MALQILDVFQNKCGGPMVVNDISNCEKQIALFHIVEAVQVPEAYLLRDARDAEGLAWEPAAKYVVWGNISDCDSMNVSLWALSEIFFIRLLAELIVVR